MSSYAELTLGTLSLAASRNWVDPDLIWLFRQSDKTVERIDQRNPKQLAKYIMEEYIEQYDKNNPFTCVEYRCSAAQARDRLDLKGFTREVAESGFKAGLRNDIAGLKNDIERLRKSQTLFNSSRDVFRDVFSERLDFLSALTIEDWLNALRRISNDGLEGKSSDALPPNDPQLALLRYMLGSSEHFYGFPGAEHFGLFARLAVEAVSPDEQLIYDLTSLVHGVGSKRVMN